VNNWIHFHMFVCHGFLPRLLKKLPEAFFFPNSYHQ